MRDDWRIEVIGKHHERGGFDCGEASLNDYLRRFARQNTESGTSKTYVLVRPPGRHIVGFYSILTGSIEFDNLPGEARRRLPRYPVPTVHLARLAVSTACQGQGLGELLLYDALRRAVGVADQMGVYAVTVDALHEKAKQFYRRYGFEALASDPLHLYLLVETVRATLR